MAMATLGESTGTFCAFAGWFLGGPFFALAISAFSKKSLFVTGRLKDCSSFEGKALSERY